MDLRSRWLHVIEEQDFSLCEDFYLGRGFGGLGVGGVVLLVVGGLAVVSVVTKPPRAPVAATAPNLPMQPQITDAKTIRGQARVVDGDTIQIGTAKIRLHGIDAPEMAQACERGGAQYSCGVRSKQELIGLVGGRELVCDPTGQDRWGRLLARCFMEKIDIGQWMVNAGWAVAFIRYSTDYADDEARAKSKGLGVWIGNFSRPDEWRHNTESRNVKW